MKLEAGELVATGAELAAAPAVLNYPVGDLSRLPRVPNTPDDEAAVVAFFETVADDLATANLAAIATLAKPERIGVLHYTLGEESISRAILAWGPETGNAVVLMVSGGSEGWHIRIEPVESLVGTISSVLLENTPLNPVDIRCAVTQEAALVFLAALQLLRESRLLSLMSHRIPPTAFTVEAVEEVLNNSGTEDFRWPFFFFDKILPFSANGVSWTDTIPVAFEELAGRELVAEVDGSNGKTWQLTESGYRMALAQHHHLTKVGLRITEVSEDESGMRRRGHEGLLLIRSLQDLLLYDLAGKEAAIATIDFKGLKDLATEILSLEKPEPVSEASTAAAESKRSCPACAARIAADAAFCPECGMSFATAESSPHSDTRPEAGAKSKSSPPPIPKKRREQPKPKPRPAGPSPTPPTPPTPASSKFCKNCGGPLKPDAKFCGSCGQKT